MAIPVISIPKLASYSQQKSGYWTFGLKKRSSQTKFQKRDGATPKREFCFIKISEHVIYITSDMKLTYSHEFSKVVRKWYTLLQRVES